MSSPWASPDPTDSARERSEQSSAQPGFTAPGAQPAQPGFTAPGAQPAQPGFVAPGTQPVSPLPAPQNGQPRPDAGPGASGYSQSTSWAWAAKPGIIALRPLTLSDLMSGSFAALRRNPKVLFGYTIVIMTIVALVNGLAVFMPFYSLMTLSGSTSDPQASYSDFLASSSLSLISTLLSYVVLFLATFLGGALINGVLSVTVSQMVIGKKITFGQAWSMVRRRLLPKIGASFLLFLIIAIPMILWGVGFLAMLIWSLESKIADSLAAVMFFIGLPLMLALYSLTVRFLYAPICAVLEHKGPIQSLKRSWTLTSGAFWMTLGRVLLIGVVCGVIVNIISTLISVIVLGIGFAFLSSASFDDPNTVWSFAVFLVITSALQTLVYSLVLPIMSAYQTLMYVDQKIRKENFALVLACGAPLTPDNDEAQSWLSEELSRAEYNADSNPIARFIQSFLDGLSKATSWSGTGAPPISLVLIILGIIALAAIIVALILNPIRLRSRASHSVFEEETTAEDVRASLDEAVAAGDWDLAYVWSYRLLVLGLDTADVVSSTPGLTAKEAADAATRLAAEYGQQLGHHARTFDRVRYGHSSVSREDVDALRELVPLVVHACQRAQENA